MIVPVELEPLLRKQIFWRRFYWDLEDDHEYPELEECEVAFPLGAGAALVLELDEELEYFSLNLRHPSLDADVELGWDDQAHWHPHVLRWEEVDLIGRWVALSYPELPHPGPVVALLHRFTPLCRGDDPGVVQALLEGAYRALGVYRGKALEEQLARFDYRAAGFDWREDPERGWVLAQDRSAPDAAHVGLYTLRHAQETRFPFAAWNGVMAELRGRYQHTVEPTWLDHDGGRAGDLARSMAESGKLTRLPELAAALEAAGCRNAGILAGLREGAPQVTAYWILELLLGEAPGALIRRHGVRKPRQQRIVHRFELTVPGFPVRKREIPDCLCLALKAELDRQLREQLSGRAEMVGMQSTHSEDGKTLLEESITIGCWAVNDAEEAIRIIRAVLRELEVPPGTTLRQTAREEQEIPLSEPLGE